MKPYTKGGDSGSTSLIGGKRVSKDHVRIEAYGTIDELISQMGVVRSFNIADKHKVSIKTMQQKLMDCSALLASETDIISIKIDYSDIEFLEKEIDDISADMPNLKNFVVPGDTSEGAFCHVARCVCRRAERGVITLSHQHKINENIIKYINRLSDYLFVLALELDKKATL